MLINFQEENTITHTNLNMAGAILCSRSTRNWVTGRSINLTRFGNDSESLFISFSFLGSYLSLFSVISLEVSLPYKMPETNPRFPWGSWRTAKRFPGLPVIMTGRTPERCVIFWWPANRPAIEFSSLFSWVFADHSREAHSEGEAYWPEYHSNDS